MALIRHNIGISIKKARKMRKLTQVKMAKKLGMSRSYLSLIENDKHNPSLDLLKRMSYVLEIPIAFILLLGLDEDCLRKRHKIKMAMIKNDMQSMVNNIFTD